MNKQPKALQLADDLEESALPTFIVEDAAAELRRLYAANIDCINHFNVLMDERNELLESLKEIASVKFSNWSDGEMRQIASAAIAKATGEQA